MTANKKMKILAGGSGAPIAEFDDLTKDFFTDGSRYYTKPMSKQLEKVFTWNDGITRYLFKHDKIIIP